MPFYNSTNHDFSKKCVSTNHIFGYSDWRFLDDFLAIGAQNLRPVVPETTQPYIKETP